MLRKPHARSEGLQIDFNSWNNPRWVHAGRKNGEVFLYNSIISLKCHYVGNNSGTRLNKRGNRCRKRYAADAARHIRDTKQDAFLLALVLKTELVCILYAIHNRIISGSVWNVHWNIYFIYTYFFSVWLVRISRICGFVLKMSGRTECGNIKSGLSTRTFKFTNIFWTKKYKYSSCRIQF